VAQAGPFRIGPLDLEVREGEYFVVLGPSGSGKTVLLETIAGVRSPAGGRLLLDGRDAAELSPEQRRVGFVYQDSLLFPNLDVAGNIAFGLGPVTTRAWVGAGLRRRPRAAGDPRVAAAADLVGAGELLQRAVGGLSGGEQQRVALARAMVTEPRLLLLDEPLANLDQPTREGLQSVLRQIHRRFPTTVVHVTHDLPEATVLADRCAVLGDGRLHQVGAPGDVFGRPADEFVARLTGGRNVFRGLARRAGDHTIVEIDGPTRLVSTTAMTGRVGVSVRPEELQVSAAEVSRGGDRCPTGRAADNRLEGVVTEVLDLGATALVRVALPVTLTALMTRRQVALQSLSPGLTVHVELAASAVHLFEWQGREQPGGAAPDAGGIGADDRSPFGGP